jgi:hypothetical protein
MDLGEIGVVASSLTTYSSYKNDKYVDLMNLPHWFEKGKEPAWFIEATKEWKDSTVLMPD